MVSLEKDFANAPFPGTWYSVALANNLSGSDQNGSTAEIDVQINARGRLSDMFTGESLVSRI